MKVDAKQFDINKKRPKVLLLGNGINRAFHDETEWDLFLDTIATDKNKGKAYSSTLPTVLKATLLTENHVYDRVKCEIGNLFRYDIECEEKKILLDLLSKNFDYILTTNYTYEIESVLLNSNVNVDGLNKRKYNGRLVQCKIGSGNAQRKYLTSTFYRIDGKYDVFHVHGELRKVNSMAICHDYYGSLVRRISELFDKAYNYNGDIQDWIDAFIYGDVYIVGLGLDFSEEDLWWILSKKSTIKDHGDTYYISPKIEKNDQEKIERNELLNILGVNTTKYYISKLFKDPNTNKKTEDYKKYYEKIIKSLQI